MSDERFTGNTRDFAVKLRTVPAKIEARRNEFVFESVAQLYNFLADQEVTPRDTGYLANGLSITAAGQSPPAQPKRRADAEAGEYGAPQLDPTALALAIRSGEPFVIGYQAEYAPYVEDRRHMMKQAKGRWGSFQRNALEVVRARAGAS